MSKTVDAARGAVHAVSHHRRLFVAMVGLFTLLPVPVVFMFMLFTGGNLPTYVGVGDFISYPLLLTDISLERKMEIFLGEGLFYIGYLDPKGAAVESSTPNTYVYYVLRVHNLLLQIPTAVLAGIYISLAKTLKKEACAASCKPVRRSRALGFSGLLVDTWAKIHITFAPLGACPTCIAGNVFTVSMVSLAGITVGMMFSNAAALTSYALVGGLILYMGSKTDWRNHVHCR
ncbi:MAG: hypothetical protein QXX19_01810 [Candidatus Caldarchaeum sp.]